MESHQREFEVILSKAAQKYLDKLTDFIAEPIIDILAALAEGPRPPGYTKLKGRDAYRIRTGNYRIIYEIQDQKLTVLVVAIGDRKENYKWR